MSVHSGLYTRQSRRLVASTAVAALALVMGAGPIVAGDPALTPAAAEVALTVVPMTVTAGAVCPSTGPVSGASAPGGFEIDGNCPQDGAGTLDWNSPEVVNQPVANDMLLGVGDTTESIANAGKTDIQYVYAYPHGDSEALWLDFAFSRDKATGSVRYELELNQLPANTGPTNSVPARTVGDYLFNITQSGNGLFALNSVQRWTVTGWSTPTGTTGVVGKADAAGFFFETSFNLTALTGVTTSCPPSTLFTTVNLRTQSSTSDNSAFADYITGLTIPPPNNCPTLTLNKHVVGGTAAASAWALTAHTSEAGAPAPLDTVSGTTGVTGAVVPAKTYALSEAGPSGYTGSLWTCSNAIVSGPIGHQTVILGTADATCEITNTATSTLTVKKTNLTGDDLRGATFVLHSGTAEGAVVGSCTTAAVTGTCSVSNLGFGTYYWVETVAPAGYLLPTGAAAVFGPVTVSADNAGQTIATTVVRDVPETHLTLKKTVSSTFGGTALASAWTLAAAGPTPGITGKTGETAVTNVAISPGEYALSESGGPSGYAGTWSCTGATLAAKGKVTVTVGQSATCTVNNADLPAHLTLVKEVVNDHGGSALNTAWTLTATGPTSITGHTGTPAVTGVAVSTGSYTLSEADGPAGYSASAWVCSDGTLDGARLTLALNQSATCTITNTFVPVPVSPSTPSISLVKLATLGDTNANGKADAGETISYSFRVTNTGDVALTTVAVADPKLDLHAGLSAVTCTPTTLLPAAVITCTAAAYTVTDADVANGLNIVNEATASGQPPTGSRVSATDTVSTPTAKPVVAPVSEVEGVVEEAPVVVTPAPTTLAFTGAETVPLGLSGLLALVLGVFLTVASRRQGAKQGAKRQGAKRQAAKRWGAHRAAE